jgi:hypothetical protein
MTPALFVAFEPTVLGSKQMTFNAFNVHGDVRSLLRDILHRSARFYYL